ncbi:hypothetical protein BVRB_4g086650 [Beta vulgaris subsp. vulgaris]|nr:hypothetical protein BVRB_4g086650 [Beta vulgaris subsp. vulgaris]
MIHDAEDTNIQNMVQDISRTLNGISNATAKRKDLYHLYVGVITIYELLTQIIIGVYERETNISYNPG